MAELGGYIMRRRKQKGWSRKALSDKSGVPYSTLSNIERNENKVKPKEETLRALAKTLDEVDDTQLRALAGYDILRSATASERAQRIDALMAVAPRWEKVLKAIQEEYTLEEQDEALTQLEIHRELVRLRRRRRRS